MPELPEVETIRGQLDKVLTGKKIVDVEVLRAKSFSGDPQTLEGKKIKEIKRKAKTIEFYFDGGREVVIVHLKMTGQLIFVDGEKRIAGGHPTADWIKELPSKHTRVVWTFKDSSKLFFNDMRVFGWMKIVDKDKYQKEAREMAPDVTDVHFTSDYLFDLLKRSSRSLKLVLLDQNKMGGLGNIYVNDALFLAGIKPDRKANRLSKKEGVKLYKAIVQVINLGIKYGGASASNYVQTSGLGGTYQDHFLVYKKDGQKCLKCGETIMRIKLGGRGTFYCPNCQR